MEFLYCALETKEYRKGEQLDLMFILSSNEVSMSPLTLCLL
jgi:hypothetical protein